MHHSRWRREESLRVTHWPVLLFLAGLTTIPTELITPWTDHSSTHSGSSTGIAIYSSNLVLHTLAGTHIACVCVCVCMLYGLVTLNVHVLCSFSCCVLCYTFIFTTSTSSSPDDEPIKPHPSLCQLLFESQSPQLVSTVFSGRRVQPDYEEMTSPLDWFATGYCIAHSDTTSSWSVQFGAW